VTALCVTALCVTALCVTALCVHRLDAKGMAEKDTTRGLGLGVEKVTVRGLSEGKS
jgi:hypothetical protein